MMEKVVVKNLYKVFGDEPDAAMALLEQGVDKQDIFDRTGQTVGVCDASFSINAGEIFVIMGLSGSGKSTLVRLLNRLIEPTAGQVLVDGRDIAAMNDDELLQLRRKDMSMVFQSFALMPHLTVLQNTAFGLELGDMPAAEREPRALQALDGSLAREAPAEHRRAAGIARRSCDTHAVLRRFACQGALR